MFNPRSTDWKHTAESNASLPIINSYVSIKSFLSTWGIIFLSSLVGDLSTED